MAIMNGWLFNVKTAIDDVFGVVRNLIRDQEVVSEPFRIFHANEVKEFIEATTNHGVEIIKRDNRVSTTIVVRLNLDFEKLSESEWVELVKKAHETD